MKQPQLPIVARREQLEWFATMPGERMAFRLHSRDVGGAFTIIEVDVPPLVGPPLHYHKYREEIFEVLEGSFRFDCGGEEFDVTVGTSVVVPRGVRHAWFNLGPKRGRMMFTFVPGGIDDFFPEIGRTAPEEWPALATQQYDIWIVGPPLSPQRPEKASG